jgi:hypothetical protein
MEDQITEFLSGADPITVIMVGFFAGYYFRVLLVTLVEKTIK